VSIPLPEHWNSKILLVLVAWVLFQFYKDFKIQIPKPAWFYLIYTGVALFSLFWSENVTESIDGVIRLLPFLLFAIAYKQIFEGISVQRILLLSAYGLILQGFVLFAIALKAYFTTYDSAVFFYHSFTAPIHANAIYIATVYGIVFLIAFYHALFIEGKSNWQNVVMLLLLFGFQFLFSSKMIFAVLLLFSIILFVVYLVQKGLSKGIVLVSIALFAILITLFSTSSVLKTRYQKIINEKQIEAVFTESYFGRGYYWNGLTLRLFQLRCFYEIETDPQFNSLLGTGYNASQSVLNQKYAAYDLYRGPNEKEELGGYFVYNFHNQYAQLIAETGIFGLLLLLLMLYLLVGHAIRTKNILLLLVLLLFLFWGFTESYLLRQKGIVSFVLFPLLLLSPATDKQTTA